MDEEGFRKEPIEVYNISYEAGAQMGVAEKMKQNANEAANRFIEKFAPKKGDANE